MVLSVKSGAEQMELARFLVKRRLVLNKLAHCIAQQRIENSRSTSNRRIHLPL
jgi:hypothetical protein